MKIAIMQPYFLPYIGYFQLLNAVNKFVVYDNIQFSKKGWVQRNRILSNGKDEYISLPLKKDSDFLEIRDRYLSDSFDIERKKILRRISENYRKAAYFESAFPIIEKCISFPKKNLFEFVLHSILEISEYLKLAPIFLISSQTDIDHSLKSEDKVIALCNSLQADNYINPIGGLGLYSKDKFFENGIQLNFIKSKPVEYKQFNNEFIPWLSIIDIMMFNSKEQIKTFLNNFELV